MIENKNPTKSRKTVPVSIITSADPKLLTKRMQLRNGACEKIGGGILKEGKAEITNVVFPDGFMDLLPELNPNQALTYGLPIYAPVKLVTKEEWHKLGKPKHAIPRSNETFYWNDGPGIMMLDYDPRPEGPKHTGDDLVQVLRSTVKGLMDATMLWWPSASSLITNADTGEQLLGLNGQRIYFAVTDARDIPRAGAALIEHLWAEGFGYCEVSKSGSLLSRTVFDGSVWQPNRLDFVAGASCEHPLRQDRGGPVLITGTVDLVDTALAIPDPTDERKLKAEALRVAAKREKAPHITVARNAWIETCVNKITGDNLDNDAAKAARAIAKRAIENEVLCGDFIIYIIDAGKPQPVTVTQVLDHPLKYHGILTLDPLEPDYNNKKVVGKLYTLGGRPNLFSFAHGGRNFKLQPQLTEVELIKGRTSDAVDVTLETLRHLPDVFDFGGALVIVDQGHIHPQEDASLIYFLGGVTQFWRWHMMPNKAPVKILEDPPARIAKQILSIGSRRNLRPLTAVVTAPTLRPDGTVLDLPGYDDATGILFETKEDVVPVPLYPTNTVVAKALGQLLKPFKEFPVVDAENWGVLLAALLTAAVRPVLSTAPAFGFDAPVQGSGKSLLANCIATLVNGGLPTVWPHTAGRDDEEVRKRLFTALRQGERALVWDNVVGTFDSAAMAAALTSDNFTDRVLGKSESISIPNRVIILLTGNNLTLAGDMARRVLVCRIDPRTEQPFAREFDLDPLIYVQKHRQEMIAAAITIIRGYLNSNTKRASGRMASFEVWDDFVRQTVAWVGRDIKPGEFGDPMNAIIQAQTTDPEQETLGDMLLAWSELYENRPVSSAEIVKQLSTDDSMHIRQTGALQDLRDNLCEFSDRATASPKSLGRVLKYRAGRIVGGRLLEQITDKHTNVNRWRVVEVD